MSVESDTPCSQTDVLVIGAGPSGLMAAQALARLGISVQVVDRRDRGAQYGNADGLQPRTLEIWQSYGMLHNIINHSAAMHAIISYEQEEGEKGLTRSSPSYNVIVDSRYPFELTASIKIIEQTLRHSLEEAGAQIIQPAYPLSIDILPKVEGSKKEVTYPVKVVLQHIPPGQGFPPSSPVGARRRSLSFNTACCNEVIAPEKRIVLAKYVIGADGAYSWVRRHLGIRMEGEQTEYVWGVIDVTIETDFPDWRFKCVIQSSTGALIIIPREEEKVRIYVQMSPQECPKNSEGRLDKSSLPPEVVRAKVLARVHEGLRPYTVEIKHVFWCTIFSVPQKVANQFSIQNRVFVVGDACHTHSPKAGQGANASMGDSHNLAWKIAHVVRGWAKPSLLDTYEVERRTYAQELIAFDKHIAQSLAVGSAADYQSGLHQHNMFTSGVGIHYKSRLSGFADSHAALHIRVGERVPPGSVVRLADWQPMDIQDLMPSDGLFKVLVFACDILVADQCARLNQFAHGLEQVIEPGETGRLSLYTVLSSTKENLHWRTVPSPMRYWKRVVTQEKGPGNVYKKLGIDCQGAAVLVRPDGYISLLTRLNPEGARQIVEFIREL